MKSNLLIILSVVLAWLGGLLIGRWSNKPNLETHTAKLYIDSTSGIYNRPIVFVQLTKDRAATLKSGDNLTVSFDSLGYAHENLQFGTHDVEFIR